MSTLRGPTSRVPSTAFRLLAQLTSLSGGLELVRVDDGVDVTTTGKVGDNDKVRGHPRDGNDGGKVGGHTVAGRGRRPPRQETCEPHMLGPCQPGSIRLVSPRRNDIYRRKS